MKTTSIFLPSIILMLARIYETEEKNTSDPTATATENRSNTLAKDANAITMEKQGRIALNTGYMHLRIDLNIMKLLQDYHEIKTVVTIAEDYEKRLDLADDADARSMRKEVDRIDLALSRLMTLLRLATGQGKEQFDFDFRSKPTAWSNRTENQWDNMDEHPDEAAMRKYNEEIQRIAQIRGANSSILTNSEDKKLSRPKRGFVDGLFSAASFGLGLYNTFELTRINGALEGTQKEIDIIAGQVKVTDLKINQVIAKLEEYKEDNNEALRLLALNDRKTWLRTIKRDIQHYSQLFASEIQDYQSAFQQLLHRRFSPLIVDTQALDDTFKKLVTDAGKRGLKPLIEDSNIIFQSDTSLLVHHLENNEGIRLLAFVHLPLYKGSLANLFRNLETPLYMDSYMIKISHSKKYLALDDANRKAVELDEADLRDCLQINGIFHCPNLNLVTTDPESLCLFNLKVGKALDIKRTCPLMIDSVTHSATKLSKTTFRLISPTTTTLNYKCNGETKSQKADFIEIIQLNRTCSYAWTNQYQMTLTEELNTAANLTASSFPIDPTFLIQELREMEIDTDNIASHLDKLKGGHLSPIDVATFSREMKKARIVAVSYMHGFLTQLVLGILICALVTIAGIYIAVKIYRCIRNRNLRRLPVRQEIQGLHQRMNQELEVIRNQRGFEAQVEQALIQQREQQQQQDQL